MTMKTHGKMNLAIISLVMMLIAFSCKKDDDGDGIITVTDIDGNVYHTVKIGSQVWMVENLKTLHFRNGDPIPTTSPANKDISGETDPIYQWAYDANDVLAEEYGRLYTWHAVTDPRGICPEGWHVPTDAEWVALLTTLGGIDAAGAKLIETGVDHWPASNTDATNESGFTALPGGGRIYIGDFFDMDIFGYYWTSSSMNDEYAFYYMFYANPANVQQEIYQKKYGLSVRCVKN
jgi:uncharacterized protein (TIGR02145 family)